ncbi:Tim10/DDP family zinc finger-domain-containing protein [Obelidium mucronatum]|nr:Tim10/DDP family zinc finger-domain-containing protein [Obelidium mucronatum]
MNSIEQTQKRMFLDNYKGMALLTDACFKDCVNDYTSKTLSGKEETCVKRCTEKFMKLNMRVDFNANMYHLEQQKEQEKNLSIVG